jgi:hypothetical protein
MFRWVLFARVVFGFWAVPVQAQESEAPIVMIESDQSLYGWILAGIVVIALVVNLLVKEFTGRDVGSHDGGMGGGMSPSFPGESSDDGGDDEGPQAPF